MKRDREGHDPRAGPSRLPVDAKPLGGSGRGRLPVDRGPVPAGSDFIVTAAGSRITVSQAEVSGATVTLALPSRPGFFFSSRWRRLRARSLTAALCPDASRWPDKSPPPSGHGRSPPSQRRQAGEVNGSEPVPSARRCGSTGVGSTSSNTRSPRRPQRVSAHLGSDPRSQSDPLRSASRTSPVGASHTSWQCEQPLPGCCVHQSRPPRM